ncbi:MAG: MATE family efflux transporter [Candidatus Auribacterota bacterium]|nr:MATE family efflux transporter [Candidatus Auribacterota bacterium]
MKPSRDLTEGSIFRSVIHLGVPTIAISLLQSGFNLVDMFFVGKLGPTALAAVTISGIVIALLITLAVGISIGTLSLVARFWGAKSYRQAALVVGQSFYISLLLSIFFGIGGWFVARPLLNFLGGRGEVLELAVVYFRIISAGAWTIFIFVTFSSALRGAGDAWTPFKVMALGVVLNCILDPILIFGWGPIPRMGVHGSALATIFSRLITTGVIIFLTGRDRTHLNLSGAFRRIDLPLMGKIVRIGFFSSAEMLIRSLAVIGLLRIVSPFGTAALAAYGIGTRIRMIGMMPGIGMGYAAGTMVGQSLGAGLPDRGRRSTWLAWRIYIVLLLPLVLLLLIFSESVVGFFNHDPGVLTYGKVFIAYIAVTLIFLSLTLVLGKALQGAGDTRGPMVITFISMMAMWGLAWIGSTIGGLEGVWQGILAASIFNSFLILYWFRRGGWQRLQHMSNLN